MDKPISVGDLVVVVKPTQCCGSEEAIGETFVAHAANPDVNCQKCGRRSEGAALFDGRRYFYLVNRLKRIPPLDELESEKRDEEITA